MRFVTLVLMLLASVAQAEEGVSPLQAQVDQTKPGDVLHIAPGHYPGTLHLHRAITLEGSGLGETTLRTTVGATVIIDGPGVALRNMTIVGPGAVVVRAGGELSGSGLDLWSGGTGLLIDASAEATIEGSSVTCEATEKPVGVSVAGSFEATDSHFSGPCHRSIHVGGGSTVLRRVVVEGAVDTGVHVVGATALLEDVRASIAGLDGSVVFAGSSTVSIKRSTIIGGLEGVLFRGGKAELSGVTIRGAGSLGLGGSGLAMHLDHDVFEGPFTQGAILVQERAVLRGEDIAIRHTGAAGVLVIRAEVQLNSVHISGPRFDRDGDFGHGVVVEEAKAQLEDLTVDDAQGAGVYASNPLSQVVIAGSRFSHVGVGISVVHHAHVRASGTTVATAGIGVALTEHGELAMKDSSLQAGIGELDCEGTHLETAGVKLVSPTPRQPCQDADFDHLLRKAQDSGG